MSFRWFIYYCAMLGGCAAYVGWVLGRVPAVQHHVWQAAVRGMFLGMTLAVGLALVDILWHQGGRQGCVAVLRILVAGVVGGVGGFVGGMLGQILYAFTQLSAFLVVGWAFTGLLIGAAPGVYPLLVRLARNDVTTAARRKLTNGVLGGLLGGIVGGVLFLMIREFWGGVFGGRADEFWSPAATGFVVLGICIGMMVGLTQVILKSAWINVVNGFRAGREMLLTQDEMIIGRGEKCDIPLFGDSGVEKEHARIYQQGGRYYIEDLDSAGGTFVNGTAVERPLPLLSGDLIEVGRATLRFGERIRHVEAAE